jgi:hypothetical protein
LDFELGAGFKQADWQREFSMMKSLGIDTVTVAHVASGRPWNGTDRCFKFRPHYGRYAAFYPTKLDCFATAPEHALGLTPLLGAAANASMGVFLGLANVVSKPSVGHFIESANLNPADRFNESWSDFANIQLAVFGELWASYSADYRSVIRGVYTVLESGNCGPLYVDPQYARFLRVVSTGIKQQAPQLQVFASPGFGTAHRWKSKICNRTLSPAEWGAYWVDVFRQAPDLSFIAPQDGRGIYNSNETALEYLSAIHRAHASAGRSFGVNLEAFNFSAPRSEPVFPGTCQNRMPSSFERFQTQLRGEAAMPSPTGMTTTWEWFTCFHPPPSYCAKPPSGGGTLGIKHQKRAAGLRKDYQAYIGQLSVDVSIDGASRGTSRLRQGFVGVYHTASGNVSNAQHTSAFAVGDWGIVGVQNGPLDGRMYTPPFNISHFQEDIELLCNNASVNAVYGLLTPPSEGGVFSNTNDTDLWLPLRHGGSAWDAAHSPRGFVGMLQGAARFSTLARLHCPMIAGLVLDDFWSNYVGIQPPPPLLPPPVGGCSHCPPGVPYLGGSGCGGYFCCKWPWADGHCKAPPQRSEANHGLCCLWSGVVNRCQNEKPCAGANASQVLSILNCTIGP